VCVCVCGQQAPELQTMYRMNMPVSSIRTKMRQEFERHRYVAQLPTVDVLLFHSHQEFQVRTLVFCVTMLRGTGGDAGKLARASD